jgi:hypothetical protein
MVYDTPYEQKTDSGKLMASAAKKHDKSPDYWGELAINPDDLTNVKIENGMHIFKLSGWKRKSKTGNTFLSIAISRYVAEEDAPKKAELKEEDFPF